MDVSIAAILFPKMLTCFVLDGRFLGCLTFRRRVSISQSARSVMRSLQ